jgi:predicted DNA-binding protein
MNKTVNICIRFPPELYEKLRKIKEAEGIPIHFQVLRALEEYLSDKGEQK